MRIQILHILLKHKGNNNMALSTNKELYRVLIEEGFITNADIHEGILFYHTNSDLRFCINDSGSSHVYHRHINKPPYSFTEYEEGVIKTFNQVIRPLIVDGGFFLGECAMDIDQSSSPGFFTKMYNLMFK
jgi:hypothetical protein